MPLIKNTVLLLKSERSEGTRDKYEDLLRSNSFEVIQVKTLSFQYKNIDILRQKLLNPENFSGIVLSSPRCVNATHQALNKEKLRELWNAKANFTVGETTHEEALEKLGIECKGKETGNAKNLAQLIIKDSPNYSKPFLFPHGNLKTDTLKLELGKENLEVEGVLVYDTLPNPDIENDLSKATNEFTKIPEFVVFFSPSGFRNSIPYLRKIQDFDLMKIVAIGPVTELALQEEKLRVYSVAKSPTPEEVLKSV
ncbi:uroporphyrinogen-III synthase, partial [Asbolus verrucosus]